MYIPSRDRNFILSKVQLQSVEGSESSEEEDELVASDVDDGSDIDSDSMSSAPNQSRKNKPVKRIRTDRGGTTQRKKSKKKRDIEGEA